MEKLLYLDVCIRGEQSRTKKIACRLLEKLESRYTVEKLDLTALPLHPLDPIGYTKRVSGGGDPKAQLLARKFAAADRIVIAAPFWDMSFPAALKIFCEAISLYGITFGENPDGSTCGLCAASRLLLITTRGMEIPDGSPLEQGSTYLKALCWLWGIGQVDIVSAWGLDVCDQQTCERRLQQAVEQGLQLCEEF